MFQAHATIGAVVEPLQTRSSASGAGERLKVSLHRGGPEILARHAGEWNALCDRARPDLAFIRPELVSVFLDVYALNARVVLLTAHRDGELVALLPLVEKSIGFGPFRINWLRTASQAQFQRHDAIHVEGEAQEVIAAGFWHELRTVLPRHLMHLETALTDGVLARMRDLAAEQGRVVHVFDAQEAPYITVPAPDMEMDDVIAAQSRRVRRLVRGGLRRLEERGALRVVYVADEAEGVGIGEWVERFRDLEHSGWKGEAGSSINSDISDRHFYQKLVQDECFRPYFRCLAIMLDDEMIAADLGFLVGETYFSDKLAMNEEYRDCSPGHLLHLFLLLQCAGMGVTTLNLGGIAEPYKMYWTDKALPFSTILIFPGGVLGRLVFAGLFNVAIPARNRLRTLPIARQAWRVLRRFRASLMLGGSND